MSAMNGESCVLERRFPLHGGHRFNFHPFRFHGLRVPLNGDRRIRIPLITGLSSHVQISPFPLRHTHTHHR
jgi:hypothetical protein